MSENITDDLTWCCENNPTPNYEITEDFSRYDSKN